MFYVYLIAFLVGGTVLLLQFLLSLVGLGGHHDTGEGHDFHDGGDHDAAGHEAGQDADGHDGHDTHHGHGHGTQAAGQDSATAWFVGLLTFRTVVAALTFFGIGGLAALEAGLDPLLAVGVAVAAGLGALLLVAHLMRALGTLRSDGAVRIQRAVGVTGTVYLGIPANRTGAGKVTLNLQNRTVEYQAVTPQQELPTGTKIKVVAVLGSDTVEVVSCT
jgi:hypothetical protein